MEASQSRTVRSGQEPFWYAPLAAPAGLYSRSSPGKASVHFSKKQTRSLRGGADAFVAVRQHDASFPSTKLPSPAGICQIVVTGSFPGLHITGPTSLDLLHSENLAAVSSLQRLGVWARPSNQSDLNGIKKILCAVLRRTQLSWALDSRRLEFIQRFDSKRSSVLSSASILSRPAEHIVGDKPVTLDVPEQAEWLLHFQPKNRNAYLRQLVAQRAASSTPVDIAPADRKSTRLNSSHSGESRMPSSA